MVDRERETERRGEEQVETGADSKNGYYPLYGFVGTDQTDQREGSCVYASLNKLLTWKVLFPCLSIFFAFVYCLPYPISSVSM